jgi:uncharacterized protein YjgD (DUF1641 family)
MAKPIAFTPRAPEPAPAPADAAREELDTLLIALHERGILRLVNGLLAAGPEVSARMLDGLSTPAGERVIRNAVALGTAAARIDPNRMQQMLDGVARGMDAAGERLGAEPPGSVSLLRELRDPDVRRGMHALIGFLKAFGVAHDDGNGTNK